MMLKFWYSQESPNCQTRKISTFDWIGGVLGAGNSCLAPRSSIDQLKMLTMRMLHKTPGTQHECGSSADGMAWLHQLKGRA